MVSLTWFTTELVCHRVRLLAWLGRALQGNRQVLVRKMISVLMASVV